MWDQANVSHFKIKNQFYGQKFVNRIKGSIGLGTDQTAQQGPTIQRI